MTEETTPYAATPEASPYVPPTPEKKAFLAALAAAQGEFEEILRNRTVSIKPGADARSQVPYTFSYAELSEVLKKTRPACAKNGLSLRSRVVPGEPGRIWIQSILAHAEGYEDLSEMSLEVGKDVKQFGGLISYLRRYMGVAQLGVASEDDIDSDGMDSDQGNFGAPASPPRGTPQRRAPAPPAAKAPAPAPAPAQAPATAKTGFEAPAQQPAADAAPPNGPSDDGGLFATDTKSPAGQKIGTGQARWMRNKMLDSLGWTQAEIANFFAENNLAGVAIDDLTEAQFLPLRAKLIEL